MKRVLLASSGDDADNPGRRYLLLVANNTIMRYIDVDELSGIGGDALVHWLKSDAINIPNSKKVVIAFSTRETKAKKRMATVVFSDKDKKLDSALIFPSAYAKSLGRLKPGNIVSVLSGTLDDGTKFIREIQ